MVPDSGPVEDPRELLSPEIWPSSLQASQRLAKKHLGDCIHRMAIVQVVQDKRVIELDFGFQDLVQVRDAVPDDRVVLLDAARAQRWAEQFAHGGMVCRILCREDVSAGNTLVEWGLEEDAAFADGGVDVAEGFHGVGCCLARSEAGNFACKVSIQTEALMKRGIPYFKCNSWNW